MELNANWASTWTGWQCPCCGRDKIALSRMSEGNVLLCRLELHHDHIEQSVKAIFNALDPRAGGSDDADHSRQRSDAKAGALALVERFRPTLICMDCNLAEGETKLRLPTIHRDFTFSPNEIARFIRVLPNQKHEIDLAAAAALWTELREDFNDRVGFAEQVARRFAQGRHRREHSSRGVMLKFEDRDFFWSRATDAEPRLLDRPISQALANRSISNDTAFASPKPSPHRTRAVSRPTDEQFVAIVENMQTGRRTWDAAGEDWKCPCCNRTKRELCRKSGSNAWTAHIHWVRRWKLETDEVSLGYRTDEGSKGIVLGEYETAFLCHDCRNVITKTCQKSGDRRGEDSLTLEDIRSLLVRPEPHRQHEFDMGAASALAEGNAPLVEAVRGFEAHKDRAKRAAERHASLTGFQGFDTHQATAAMAQEVAAKSGEDVRAAIARMSWLVGEGQRLHRLDMRQKAIRTGGK